MCIDITAVIISILALGLSTVNFVKNLKISKRNLELSEEQGLLNKGGIELQIEERLRSARAEMLELGLRLKPDDGEILSQTFYAANEQFRNAYEIACSLYLDGKVDRDRFKKSYAREIRQLVEDPVQNEFYNNIKSAYPCTKKVYDEWNNQT